MTFSHNLQLSNISYNAVEWPPSKSQPSLKWPIEFQFATMQPGLCKITSQFFKWLRKAAQVTCVMISKVIYF